MPVHHLLIASLAIASAACAGTTQSVGPAPYRQASDSPATCVTFVSFFIEDFEDHALDTPGLSATSGFVTSAQFASARDSVDADDGDLNESSSSDDLAVLGDSWYVEGAASFLFDARALGGLPTHAGVVLTDATFAPSTVTAFDEFGLPFATLLYEFPDPGDSLCADDWFYGFFSEGGVSRIEIVARGDIEVDHVQYGFSDLSTASDLDGDGIVGGGDLGILLANWGTPCLGELTGDFVIDGADLGVVLANWS